MIQMQEITKELIKKRKKLVTIEEERNTLEYQETMDLGIENIASTSQQILRSIYELIYYSYFKAVRLFPTQFLDYCKKRTSKQTK